MGGPKRFRDECFRSLRAVRDAYGDGTLLHPWIDIDFSSLGTERTVIDGAHRRAITVPELRKLIDFLARHADEKGNLVGTDADGTWRAWWSRSQYDWLKPLNKDTINLYSVADWIIKPFTARAACSFVELVVDKGTVEQCPQWFVSHWWGEPVRDFVASVEAHAKARDLDESAAYWVLCAHGQDWLDFLGLVWHSRERFRPAPFLRVDGRIRSREECESLCFG